MVPSLQFWREGGMERENGDNSTYEIEVTPEMVEAGVTVIWEELGGADLGGLFSASDLAKSVYLAMHNAQSVKL
jgi:hypothetical protein